jgi:type VI secretion system protein ImpH
MATPFRAADAPLAQALFEEPYRFDFFQAVRLLQCQARPECAAIGQAGPPAHEAVRFLARRGLAFPASSIDRIEPPADPRNPATMTVSFLGLTGPSGVLPRVYTELIPERPRGGDRALAAFFDLINHRVISLFYRAWEKPRVALDAERGDHGRFAGHVFALMGLGLASLRQRHAVPDGVLLKYAAYFAQQRRPAVVLEALLRDYSGLPVEVIPFTGRWITLDPDDRSTLGGRGGQNALGVSTVLGSRVWDEAGQVRLRLGPLSFAEFRDHLPDGSGFRPLVELARLFVGAEFDLDVQLVLKAAGVPRCRLSSRPGAAARLGRGAWLLSRPMTRDADDAVFPAGD